MVGLPTVIIDPYFHYHAPLECFQYPLYDERYQNDGIIKHFSYDAIITGTSMTENFMVSDLNEAFDVEAIKIPFFAASYKEIDQNIRKAIEVNPNIKIVLRGLDYSYIEHDKDFMQYGIQYPTYLYDDNILNDVNYILNKSILYNGTLRVVDYTKTGSTTTSFDEYVNWNADCVFGKTAVSKNYTRSTKVKGESNLTDEQKENIRLNIEQNVTQIAAENRDIDFYLFWTPYSIYFWDNLNQTGCLEKQLQIDKYASKLLMEYENIHLFSFYDNYEMICNLDNYKDIYHYGEWINKDMIKWMKDDRYQLTKENYDEYWDSIHEFYTTYDYEALFAE